MFIPSREDMDKAYLNNFGDIIGSSNNPIILVDIPENIVVKHNSTELTNANVYLTKDKMDLQIYHKFGSKRVHMANFSVTGTTSDTPAPLWYIEMIYNNGENPVSSYYYDTLFTYTPGTHIDTLTLTREFPRMGHVLMIDGQTRKIGLNLTHLIFDHLLKCVDAMVHHTKGDTEVLSSLSHLEKSYISYMLEHEGDISSPYENMNRYYAYFHKVNKLCDNMAALITQACHTGEIHHTAASCLEQGVSGNYRYNEQDLLVCIARGHWDIAKLLLNICIDRQSVLDKLIHDQSILRLPDEFLYALYNWRKTEVTEKIASIFTAHGQGDRAQRLKTRVFQSSPLQRGSFSA